MQSARHSSEHGPLTAGPSRRTLLDLALCLALAFVLHSWQLGSKDIWLDEAASWDTAVSSRSELLRKTAYDIHPPLYYTLLGAWTTVAGDSLEALRGPSVLASLIATVLLFFLAGGFLPRAVRLAAVLWFVLSPHTVFFAQEARMYPMATAAVLGACLAYRRWVHSGFTSRMALAGYAVAAGIAIYTHYFTALALGAIGLHYLAAATGRFEGPTAAARAGARAWTLAHVLIATAYLPWAPAAFDQIARGQSWRADVTPGLMLIAVGEFPLRSLAGMITVPGPWLWLPFGLMVLVLAAGLGALAIRARPRRRSEADAFLAILIAAPFLVAVGLLPFVGFLTLPRYLAWMVPLMMVGCARGLLNGPLTAGRRPVVWLLVMVGLSVPYLWLYYRAPARDYHSTPVIARLRSDFEAAAPQDATGPDIRRLVVAPGYLSLVVRYAWRNAPPFSEPLTPDELARMLAGWNGRDPVWVYLDYRWMTTHGEFTDPRFVEVKVPGADRGKIRLYRSREAAAIGGPAIVSTESSRACPLARRPPRPDSCSAA